MMNAWESSGKHPVKQTGFATNDATCVTAHSGLALTENQLP